jgi:hypothetical protein
VNGRLNSKFGGMGTLAIAFVVWSAAACAASSDTLLTTQGVVACLRASDSRDPSVTITISAPRPVSKGEKDLEAVVSKPPILNVFRLFVFNTENRAKLRYRAEVRLAERLRPPRPVVFRSHNVVAVTSLPPSKKAETIIRRCL